MKQNELRKRPKIQRDQCRLIRIEIWRAIWSCAVHYNVTGGRWLYFTRDNTVNGQWSRQVRLLFRQANGAFDAVCCSPQRVVQVWILSFDFM